MNTPLSPYDAGVAAAKLDFDKLYAFYAGTCDCEKFSIFLTIGDFFVSAEMRRGWRETIFAEIDKIDASLGQGIPA